MGQGMKENSCDVNFLGTFVCPLMVSFSHFPLLRLSGNRTNNCSNGSAPTKSFSIKWPPISHQQYKSADLQDTYRSCQSHSSQPCRPSIACLAANYMGDSLALLYQSCLKRRVPKSCDVYSRQPKVVKSRGRALSCSYIHYDGSYSDFGCVHRVRGVS